MDRRTHLESLRLFQLVQDAPPHLREELLRLQCAHSPDLLLEVRSLLAFHDNPGALPAPIQPAEINRLLHDAPNPDPSPAPGDRIANFLIVHTISQGGMGRVYKARQLAPERLVAIKFIRPDIATATIKRRFQLEADSLARLHHPAIAHVYEVGAAPLRGAELPFIVMELIEPASTLTDFADARSLDTRARLELFARVCDGVHHAHSRGVLHRDLKPANILVDEHASPKIIDFGLARALEPDRHHAVTSVHGPVLGTLAYMSPEQAADDPHAIDTRCDVFALGLILFELLTSARARQIDHLSRARALRAIIDADLPAPSSIRRELRGDLDAIVATAVAREPHRRYQSAAALAADLRASLRDEPIIARRAGPLHHAVRRLRRHRAACAAASLLAVGISLGLLGSSFGGAAAAYTLFAAGLAGTSWQAFRATRATRHADAARRTADDLRRHAERQAQQIELSRQSEALSRRSAEESRAAADVQAARAEAVNEFLTTDLLGAASPLSALGPDTSLREALAAASARIDSRASDPHVESSIRSAIGVSYLGLGDYQLADSHLQRALAIRLDSLGSAHELTIAASNQVADLRRWQGRYTEALQRFGQSLSDARRFLAPDHRQVLVALNGLAATCVAMGRFDDAHRRLTEALESHRRVLGPDHPESLRCEHNLGALYRRLGQMDAAEDAIDRTRLARERVLGPSHPDTITSANELAGLCRQRGQLDRAHALYADLLARTRQALGAAHPESLTIQVNLAAVLVDLQKFEEAESLLRQSLSALLARVGDRHPNVLSTEANLATSLLGLARHQEALDLFTATLVKHAAVLGHDHPSTIACLINQAGALIAASRPDAAAECCRDASRRADASLPAGHWMFGAIHRKLGQALHAAGLTSDARKAFLDARDIFRASPGCPPAHLLRIESDLASLPVEYRPA